MKNVVVIAGPTAVGKSDLAVELAKRINGEVISADSMQVYKGMDIGSAKVTVQEMQGIPHHMIDILEPTENFDVTVFKALAEKAIEDILQRGKVPVICGGTGFYIQALLYDIQFTEDAFDQSIRDALQQLCDEKGIDFLHDMLKEVDAESAQSIPPANTKRVIRALEYFKLTGKKFSQHNSEEKQREAAYNFGLFVLCDDRDKLYERINKRVDIMLEKGLVDEVKGLIKCGVKRDNTSMQGIGYREIFDYLSGDISDLKDAVELIKKNSRHYAKRQLTWYRSRENVNWIDRRNFASTEEICDDIYKKLQEMEIIKD